VNGNENNVDDDGKNTLFGVDVPDEIFVVLTRDDIGIKQAAANPKHKQNPIVMETNLNSATKANAIGYAGRGEPKYGKCLIGRVIVSHLYQINRPQSVADMLQHENQKLDSLLDALREGDCDRDSQRYKILEWVRNL